MGYYSKRENLLIDRWDAKIRRDLLAKYDLEEPTFSNLGAKAFFNEGFRFSDLKTEIDVVRHCLASRAFDLAHYVADACAHGPPFYEVMRALKEQAFALYLENARKLPPQRKSRDLKEVLRQARMEFGDW